MGYEWRRSLEEEKRDCEEVMTLDAEGQVSWRHLQMLLRIIAKYLQAISGNRPKEGCRHVQTPGGRKASNVL